MKTGGNAKDGFQKMNMKIKNTTFIFVSMSLLLGCANNTRVSAEIGSLKFRGDCGQPSIQGLKNSNDLIVLESLQEEFASIDVLSDDGLSPHLSVVRNWHGRCVINDSNAQIQENGSFLNIRRIEISNEFPFGANYKLNWSEVHENSEPCYYLKLDGMLLGNDDSSSVKIIIPDSFKANLYQRYYGLLQKNICG